MSETPPQKVLALGVTGLSGVTCLDWFQENPPNFPDFDIILVNEVSLGDAIRSLPEDFLVEDARPLGNWLTEVRRALIRLLASDGEIYAVLDKGASWRQRYKTEYGDNVFFMFNSDWCPFPLDRLTQAGDTITVHSKRFEDYFAKTVDSWTFTLDVDNGDRNGVIRYMGEHIDGDHSPGFTPIAVNRQNQALAGYGTIEIKRAVRMISRGHWEYETPRTSGPIFFFPPPTKTDGETAVLMLLEAIVGLRGEREVPPWIDDTRASGEDALLEQLFENNEERERLEAEAKELQSRLDATRRPKRLLFDTGHSLEDVARETFEAMGIRTEDSPVSDEFVLVAEPKVLVEVKGNGKSISLADLSQLMRDKAAYLARLETNPKGLLLGNAYRLLPPDERDTKDKPNFPDNVVTPAIEQNICLLSTVTLFDALRLFKEGKLDSSEFLAQIQATKGSYVLKAES